MTSLRTRLIAAFAIATLVPLSAAMWIAQSLLDRSLAYSTTAEVDRLSRVLQSSIGQFYQRERATLKADVEAGRTTPARFAAADRSHWPDSVRAFWESGDEDRFVVAGRRGDQIDYFRRGAGGVEVHTRGLGGIHMEDLSAAYGDARSTVGAIDDRSLRRGFSRTLLVLVGLVWLASLIPIVLLARRITQPIGRLTAGLTEFAAGDSSGRLAPGGEDEVGRAIAAFNHMADQLDRHRERLVYLTRVASWQSLARKMAHELKNSLTPIRLTVEEVAARPSADRAFMEQAAQIVISEIETLERRVRAFSEFATEPAAPPEAFDINALIDERLRLLKPGRQATVYETVLDASNPQVFAGVDLVKGTLTNLMENAADAAGPGGRVRITSSTQGAMVAIEVHDSGPGLSGEVAATLFEPTVTFKKGGMGLGLSIARKNALLAGGDVSLIAGALGGAGFRVTLPAAARPAASS